MRYRGEVDGLRALAVVPVVLFHAGIQSFAGGFVGVDVFFVISGYLITTILMTELESGSFSIAKFYERRARRILPALFFVMLTTLPFAWAWLLPADMKSFSESLAAVAAFSSNFLFWQESGYFDTATELKPLIHTWSLAVEEQFYLLFPPLLLATWKFGRRWILASLSITAAISLIAAQLSVHRYSAFAFFMLPTRAWELAIGSVLALYPIERYVDKLGNRSAQWAGLLGLSLILFAVFTYDKQTPFPGVYALTPTMGAALVIAFSSNSTLVGRFLGSKPLAGIGLISYSAYLWHQPIFAFARQRSLHEPDGSYMLGLAILAFGLAYFTWRLIEIPFRKKDAFTRRQIFIYSVAASAFFAAVGCLGYQSNGFQDRLANNQSGQIDASKHIDAFRGSRNSDGSCVITLGLPQLSEEVCLANSMHPQILFAGDSHAMALYSSIYGKFFAFPSILVSAHSCPLYPNLSYTPTYQQNFDNNCTEISNEVLRVAESVKDIDTVVLVNYFAAVDKQKSRYWLDDVNLSNKSAFEQGYNYLVKKLIGLNKRVVFVLDVPHLTSPNRRCLQSLLGAPQMDCRYKTEENARIRQSYIAAVIALKKRFPELVVYDPTSIFCNAAYCEISKDGKNLYNDDHHVSVAGSTLIINDMLQKHIIDK